MEDRGATGLTSKGEIPPLYLLRYRGRPATEGVANLWRQKGVMAIATNPPKGPGRRGAVKERSQFLAPNGNWTKRHRGNGQIMDQKLDGEPFKGIRKEKP